MQRRLATTEAEFRCALQEGARECSDLRWDLEMLAGESVELRRALQEEHQKRKVRGEQCVCVCVRARVPGPRACATAAPMGVQVGAWACWL